MAWLIGSSDPGFGVCHRRSINLIFLLHLSRWSARLKVHRSIEQHHLEQRIVYKLAVVTNVVVPSVAGSSPNIAELQHLSTKLKEKITRPVKDCSRSSSPLLLADKESSTIEGSIEMVQLPGVKNPVDRRCTGSEHDHGKGVDSDGVPGDKHPSTYPATLSFTRGEMISSERLFGSDRFGSSWMRKGVHAAKNWVNGIDSTRSGSNLSRNPSSLRLSSVKYAELDFWSAAEVGYDYLCFDLNQNLRPCICIKIH